jgi:hypothetical protein
MSDDPVDYERTKLTATWVNNIAVAFVIGGFVAPAVNGQLDGAGHFVVSILWVGIGGGLHALGRAILGRK